MNIILDDDLLAFMGKQESQFLVRPYDLLPELKTKLFDETDIQRGITLPWSKTHKNIRLRPGEVSLWAGINGHGKSNLIGQVAAWSLDSKWLIASMEMKPVVTLERMIKQIAGSGNPTIDFIDNVIPWMNKYLWIYDQTDSVKSDRILALIKYAKSIDINHVVIDSLIKCGIAKQDLELQARFVDRICWLAKTTGVHVHLVHHVRKTESEKDIPDKYDIRGAGEIIDLVDNIFIIFRNKKKEEEKNPSELDPDCILKLAKQRHHSWEGTYKLWFDKDSGQYKTDPNRIMFHWFNRKDDARMALKSVSDTMAV